MHKRGRLIEHRGLPVGLLCIAFASCFAEIGSAQQTCDISHLQQVAHFRLTFDISGTGNGRLTGSLGQTIGSFVMSRGGSGTADLFYKGLEAGGTSAAWAGDLTIAARENSNEQYDLSSGLFLRSVTTVGSGTDKSIYGTLGRGGHPTGATLRVDLSSCTYSIDVYPWCCSEIVTTTSTSGTILSTLPILYGPTDPPDGLSLNISSISVPSLTTTLNGALSYDEIPYQGRPNPGHWQVTWAVYNASAPDFAIISPPDRSHPKSKFATLTGIAQPFDNLDVFRDGDFVGTVDVRSNGTWEQVVYLGAGSHLIEMQSTTSHLIESRLLFAEPPGTSPVQENGPYPLLKKADVILSHGVNSPQVRLYGPIYTHAALFLGGDFDGTPMIAESVTDSEAGGAGDVRAVSLDLSTVYTDGERVDIFRSPTLLSPDTRNAITEWTNNVVNKGLPYWANTDLAYFGLAYVFYQLGNGQALSGVLNRMDQLKNATGTFICSTLVWHAYWEGTGHSLDLSNPNVAIWGGLTTNYVPEAFLNILRPHFVVPDTILEATDASGNRKLKRVN